MDTVANLRSAGITEVMEVLEPTSLAFKAVIDKDLAAINDIRKETFRYGDGERHKLDIYYPPTAQVAKSPILFYAYGGGFDSGERVLPPPFDAAYPCVGAFFARQGFITVIPDYHLAAPPTPAIYPRPAEDIRDAVTWVVANPDKLTSPTGPNPDIDTVIVMGHSAGAAHAGTLLLEPEVLPANSPLRSNIKAVILIAGMYYYDVRTDLQPPAEVYYGKKAETHSVLRLLESAKRNGIVTLPKVLLVEGEYEPTTIKKVREGFQVALEAFLQEPVRVVVAERHNHISVYTALSSGQGEEWALEVSEWIWANV